MVNKNLVRIANRLGKDKFHENERSQSTLDSGTGAPLYIPSIGLHVSEKVYYENNDKSWLDWKLWLRERASAMLTPVEFWKFYEYCLENREDIVEDMNINTEYLNAVAMPGVGGLSKDLKDKNLVDGLLLEKGGIRNCLYSNGNFDFEDIHRVDGLPARLKDSVGDFRYRTIDGWTEKGLIRNGRGKYGGFGFCFDLSLRSLCANVSIGVRECKRLGAIGGFIYNDEAENIPMLSKFTITGALA
ncbi:MAG: hypothetical protein CMH62_00845 [Nanoarchaeota archaeon]|nr:hypothetical protein [Nanoarchaeota archaeon]|tara:strand:- start:815 stop:1546 length:732 start_codon:yes stop_codon:yes gene_type:complete